MITVNGEELSIGLREERRRTDHVPTADELYPRKYDFHLTGHLVLAIEDRIYDVQVRWSDGKRRRLELELST
jgi:hypothetical protein